MARMTKRLQPNNVIVYKFGKYEDTIAAEMETSDVRTVLKALADYEDLEEQCIAENQCGLRELLMKWKAFFDDIVALYDYRKAEEQGLLLRNPKDLENAILDRMQEFMEEWRCYSESSIDHFGGKVDAMEVAQKIVKGAFKSYLEEAESELAEKGGV